MALGKASIKRASAAGKKVEAENKEMQAKFIQKEAPDEKKNRPVRLTEEMPTYLL